MIYAQMEQTVRSRAKLTKYEDHPLQTTA